MTTIALNYQAIHHKITSAALTRIPWKAVYGAGLLAMVVMLSWYIFQVNQLTRGTYVIRTYEKEMSALKDENRAIQANFAQSSFLGGVMDQATSMGFEKTAKVTYVQLENNSLARAK